MLLKHVKLARLVMLLVLAVAIAGCSNSKPPKEAVQSALLNTMNLQSYTFATTLELEEIELPQQLAESQDPQVQAMIGMLKNASLTADGVYQADPMRMEMNLDLVLKGDLSFTVSVPIIAEQDKLWIKIPDIPMLPLEGLSGQYIELDLKQLAEQQGVDLPASDLDGQRQMVQDMMGIILKHFDGKQFFSETKASEAEGLPSDVKPDQIVKFSITQDQLDQVATTAVEQIAPEIIDLLLNNEQYRQSLQLSAEQLEEAKRELENTGSEELKAGLEKFKEQVNINDLSLIGAIKDNYLVYQLLKLNVDITDQGQTSTIGLKLKSQYGNINEKVEFKQPIPTEAITIDQLMALLGSGSL
ncbi:hypothetical protein AB6A23_27340 [Paenibacillus tarimensis]